ncbi:MAG: hypothetical protein RI558_00340, partial [Psychroflexus sp.]|nr:hypothetical protein [Psychroflexus sp.]
MKTNLQLNFRRITAPFLILIFSTYGLTAQVTYNGNGNTGFGGAVGDGSFLINDNGTTITVTFTRGGGNFSNSMVMYIDNGSAGRTVIDGNVNDANDPNRRAISNVGSGNITFPAGFEATHAVAINTGFGGLWTIPATGSVVDEGLGFVDGVGTPSNDSFTTFDFVFDWSEIGLTSTDNFSFVVTYGNPNDSGNTIMFSSNEAFGGGVTGGNPGSGAFGYTTYFDYPSGDIGGKAITAQAGDWSVASTWTNGNVPLVGDNVEIDHDVTLDQDATVTSVKISS